MAGYSIVLNLTGNSVRSANALATALERANATAITLRGNLAGIGTNAATMNMAGLTALNSALIAARRNARALNRALAARNVRNAATGAAAGQAASRTTAIIPPRTPNYTRHDSTRIASYGYGFNIGGFSGRLSTILQPDANGNILGMNAQSLARRLNITAIVGNIVTSIGKALFKVTAVSSLAPVIVGGAGIAIAMRTLQSESFAEGVRLISRRNMARLGLGESYERANSNADFLANSYGFDRSTTLSSINVLTGLGVGGSSRKLALGEATGLTKIGGLISQQAGVPFERVMTNIQQLLVQATPNIRDIRELLGQAPVLGKYALQEMERTGVTGVDVRTYLKDQSNLLSVLKSYELDNASNAGMQARGVIALAQQDQWAKIASNSPFWGYVGNAGSGILNSWGTGVNNLMDMLVGNQEFKVMVKQIEMIFNNMGTKGVTFLDKLIRFIDGIANRYGIDLGDKREAQLEVDRDETIRTAISSNHALVSQIRQEWEASTLPTSNDPKRRETEFQNFLEQTVVQRLLNDENVRQGITPDYRLVNQDNFNWLERFIGMAGGSVAVDNSSTLNRARRSPRVGIDTIWTTYQPNIENVRNPSSANALYSLPNKTVLGAIRDLIGEMQEVGTLDPAAFKGLGAGAAGDDLTGMNRDRRALEIHFHNKLVEWNSTITTNNPQEVVSEISNDIEQLTAAAIQKALLGATNKTGSRWY